MNEGWVTRIKPATAKAVLMSCARVGQLLRQTESMIDVQTMFRLNSRITSPTGTYWIKGGVHMRDESVTYEYTRIKVVGVRQLG